MNDIQSVVQAIQRHREEATGKSSEEPQGAAKDENPAPDPEISQEEPPAQETKSESEAWAKVYKLEANERRLKAELKKTSDLEKRLQEMEARFENAKKDPISFAEELGASPKEWVKRSLKPEASPEEKIAALEERLASGEGTKVDKEALKKEIQEELEMQMYAKQLRSDLTTTLADEKYALIRAVGAEDAAWEYLNQHASQTGQLLPLSVVADSILAGLEQQFKDYGQNEAVRALLGATKQPEPKPEQPAPKPKQHLTNKVSPSAPQEKIDWDDLSWEQQKARAVALMRGEIK